MTVSGTIAQPPENAGTLLDSWPSLADVVERHRRAGRTIVSTNGCFDILHAGHVTLLHEARRLGDVLIVGLNSDASVRALKGPSRPRIPAHDRARIVGALRAVDHVFVFEETVPLRFIEVVRPTFHCKGADYAITDLPEAELVRAYGGEVRLIPLLEGRSSSRIESAEGSVRLRTP